MIAIKHRSTSFHKTILDNKLVIDYFCFYRLIMSPCGQDQGSNITAFNNMWEHDVDESLSLRVCTFSSSCLSSVIDLKLGILDCLYILKDQVFLYDLRKLLEKPQQSWEVFFLPHKNDLLDIHAFHSKTNTYYPVCYDCCHRLGYMKYILLIPLVLIFVCFSADWNNNK